MSTSAYQQFKRTKFFGSLDGLRCLSILSVITLHATGPHAASSPWAKLGSAGVTLFFVISGVLITTLLLRERERQGTVDLAAFYARRSLRIFPLYYAVLGLYVAVVWWLERDVTVRTEFFANLPAFASYTSNWLPASGSERVIFFFAWSLATEEQFYLCWPSVEKFAPRAAPYLMVGLLAFVGLLWMEVIPSDPTGLFHRVGLSFAPGIGLGVIAAHLLHHERSFRALYAVFGWQGAAPLALALAMLSVVTHAPDPLIALNMTFLVSACCVREDNGLVALLRTPWVARVGAVSYGMYLLHMLALNLARRVCDALGVSHPGAYLLLCLVLAYAAAAISYAHFEARFLRQKARFTPAAAGAQPAVARVPAQATVLARARG